MRAALRITHPPMSQLRTRSEPTADKGNADGRLFRSLRKTAKMHDISPSYLSRCVREGESAKGHDLCSYVLFEETGDEKKVFGFAFPPGYEPADSAVGGNEHDRQQELSENGGAPGAVHRRDESHRTEEGGQGLATNGSLPEDSPDEVSRVQDDVDDLEEEVRELKSVLTRLVGAIKEVGVELSESRERQERIERAIEDFTDGVEALRDEREEQFWKLHKWLNDQFLQLGKSRRENAEIVDKQFEHLDDRISGLREWVEIVVDGAQEDLERSREQALRELSTELQEEIREPILDVLTGDDGSENLWANGISFAVVLAVTKIINKRPDLIIQGARALVGGNETGGTPLSPPLADEEAQEDSRSESG